MPPSFECERDSIEQRGSVIALVAVTVLALFAFAALAVDTGNLYRNRILLQKAADTAALAGIAYSIQRGKSGTLADAMAEGLSSEDPESTRKLVERRAQEVLIDNLNLNHLIHSPCRQEEGFEVCANYDSDTRSIVVNVSANIQLYLMHLVPFDLLGLEKVASSKLLSAEARASRPPANIALLLDVSGSMGCPSASGNDCSCLSTPGGCSGRTKIADLVAGVLAFVDYFDVHNDKFGLIPFNTRAYSIPGGFDTLPKTIDLTEATVACILAGQQPVESCNAFPPLLRPTGNTNISDAMLEAYQEMVLRRGITTKEISYLLFTDGAPDAGRFLYSHSTGLPVNATALGTYDYIHASVKWTLPDGSSYAGPSLLQKTTPGYFGYSSPLPPDPETTNPGSFVPQCHQFINSASGLPEERYPPKESKDFCKVFDGCLGPNTGPSNLGFVLPEGSAGYGEEVLCDGSDVTNRETTWRKQYFHMPVAMSDFMRQKRGTFFVIGVGPETTAGPPPYLDLNNTEFRNDYFLRRLANDFMHAVYQKPSNPDPEFQFSGYQNYAALQNMPNSREGEYVATPDASELQNVFRIMAKRIALRLTK